MKDTYRLSCRIKVSKTFNADVQFHLPFNQQKANGFPITTHPDLLYTRGLTEIAMRSLLGDSTPVGNEDIKMDSRELVRMIREN